MDKQSCFSQTESRAWIGVDLDGTLAYHEGWISYDHIGSTNYAMTESVESWIHSGIAVKIFTARVSSISLKKNGVSLEQVEGQIKEWTYANLEVTLEITCEKDCYMTERWDDRCVQVIKNRGTGI